MQVVIYRRSILPQMNHPYTLVAVIVPLSSRNPRVLQACGGLTSFVDLDLAYVTSILDSHGRCSLSSIFVFLQLYY